MKVIVCVNEKEQDVRTMNKYLTLAFVLFAALSVVRTDDDSSEEILNSIKSKHLRAYLAKNRGVADEHMSELEQRCPGVTDKLKQAITSFAECDDRIDDSLTICATIQTYALNCTRPLLNVVEGCLPQAARGLPTLGARSLVSVADYLCKQTGETIFELANPCLWEDYLGASAERTNDECDQKIEQIGEQYRENIPSSSDICTSLTGLRSCVRTQVSAECKNEKTRNAANGLFDAILAPCSNINEV